MQEFSFYTPTKFLLEKDADLRCAEYVKEFSKNVLFVHYGDEFTYKSGLHDRILNALQDGGVEVFELPGVKPNPELSLVRKGIEICRENNIGCILAVGGGSVIDTAKAVGIGVPYDGDVWDFYEKKETPSISLPVGVVMTLPATGSEASNGSVIQNDLTHESSDTMSDCIRPNFTLMNPDLTLTLPMRQTNFGIIDMLSHCLERYLSNSKEDYLTDYMAEGVMKAIIKNAYIIQKNPNNYNSRSELMWASIVAHNGLLAVGREQEWSTHTIAAQISAKYNAVHGATLSVIMPNWARYVYKENLYRFALFARNVFDIDEKDDKLAAEQGIEALRNFFSELGAPSYLKDLGADDEKEFEYMAKKACRFGNIGNIKSLDVEDIVKIYEMSR